jgi:hypothetical protein
MNGHFASDLLFGAIVALTGALLMAPLLVAAVAP